MRRNAIARIVIYSILIILLLAVLIGVLLFQTYSFHFGSSAEEQVISSAGNASFTADVEDIRVRWISGSVRIEPNDEDVITCHETGATDEKSAMRCYIDGNRLNVDFREDMSNPTIGLHTAKTKAKDLTLCVPANWIGREVEIEAVSAEVDVQDLRCRDFSLETVSGTNTFRNCEVENVDLETVSGDIQYSGTLQKLSCNGVSAKCDIAVDNNPKRINMDTVSGDLTLTLPKDCGFTLRKSTMSGKYTCDFLATTYVRDNDNKQIIGDGSCAIDIDGISGNVTVRPHRGSVISHDTEHSADHDTHTGTEHHS